MPATDGANIVALTSRHAAAPHRGRLLSHSPGRNAYHSHPWSANQVLALAPNECKPAPRYGRRMVEVRAAGPDTWPDVATVMGERGDPSRCQCQYFRLRGGAWSS